MKINNKTARKKTSERLKNGECYKLNGFTYVSVKGKPRERGFAFGKCCADDFKDIQKMLHFVCEEEYGRSWEFFVDAGKKYLKPTIKKEFAEFLEEMEGIAEGINSAGGKTDVDEILAWNNYFTLLDSWYSTFSEDGVPAKKSEGGGSKDRCSAFIATG